MNSDRVKKISLSLSVIIALILFFCLYLTKPAEDTKSDNRDAYTETGSVSVNKNTNLRENKSIYKGYKPGELSNVYINVFSTRDEEGKLHDFSSFDLIASWDKNSPVLDANVQFLSRDRQPGGQPINMPNASIRVRGNPEAALKSYRIKFMDGKDAFHGQSVFNLNKEANDPSRIANKLAHDLIIDLEHITGFRTNFTEVFIRDDSSSDGKNEFHSYGLYTHIEQPNKTYLRSHGLDENGSLYRAEDFYFQLAPQLKNSDDDEYDEKAFETVLGIREGKDHTKLIQMLKDLNDNNKDFDNVFKTYFNEDNYLTWLSVNILLGNADAMSEGFLLYNPSNSPVFYFLPWDFDGIFWWMEGEAAAAGIYERMENVILHRRYLEQAGNAEKLKGKMRELISGPFSSGKVGSLITYYKPILLEMMNRYPDNVISTIPLNEHMAYLGQIDERIRMNYNEFMDLYKE